MPEFRSRSSKQVIEARQLGAGYDEDMAIMKWCNGTALSESEHENDSEALFRVATAFGPATAHAGDFVAHLFGFEALGYMPFTASYFAMLYAPVTAKAPVVTQGTFGPVVDQIDAQLMRVAEGTDSPQDFIDAMADLVTAYRATPTTGDTP